VGGAPVSGGLGPEPVVPAGGSERDLPASVYEGLRWSGPCSAAFGVDMSQAGVWPEAMR